MQSISHLDALNDCNYIVKSILLIEVVSVTYVGTYIPLFTKCYQWLLYVHIYYIML